MSISYILLYFSVILIFYTKVICIQSKALTGVWIIVSLTVPGSYFVTKGIYGILQFINVLFCEINKVIFPLYKFINNFSYKHDIKCLLFKYHVPFLSIKIVTFKPLIKFTSNVCVLPSDTNQKNLKYCVLLNITNENLDTF